MGFANFFAKASHSTCIIWYISSLHGPHGSASVHLRLHYQRARRRGVSQRKHAGPRPPLSTLCPRTIVTAHQISHPTPSRQFRSTSSSSSSSSSSFLLLLSRCKKLTCAPGGALGRERSVHGCLETTDGQGESKQKCQRQQRSNPHKPSPSRRHLGFHATVTVTVTVETLTVDGRLGPDVASSAAAWDVWDR